MRPKGRIPAFALPLEEYYSINGKSSKIGLAFNVLSADPILTGNNGRTSVEYTTGPVRESHLTDEVNSITPLVPISKVSIFTLLRLRDVREDYIGRSLQVHISAVHRIPSPNRATLKSRDIAQPPR